MRIIAFIERKDQPRVVERILKHCGLWNPPGSRAPPTGGGPHEGSRELSYTPIEEEWLEELEQLAVSFQALFDDALAGLCAHSGSTSVGPMLWLRLILVWPLSFLLGCFLTVLRLRLGCPECGPQKQFPIS